MLLKIYHVHFTLYILLLLLLSFIMCIFYIPVESKTVRCSVLSSRQWKSIISVERYVMCSHSCVTTVSSAGACYASKPSSTVIGGRTCSNVNTKQTERPNAWMNSKLEESRLGWIWMDSTPVVKSLWGFGRFEEQQNKSIEAIICPPPPSPTHTWASLSTTLHNQSI